MTPWPRAGRHSACAARSALGLHRSGPAHSIWIKLAVGLFTETIQYYISVLQASLLSGDKKDVRIHRVCNMTSCYAYASISRSFLLCSFNILGNMSHMYI